MVSSPHSNSHSSPPRVLLIALDGLGRSPLTYSAHTPFLSSLLSKGISFPSAHAVYPTDSAPNWGSILHGVLPEKHGLTNGDVESGKEFDENSMYPSLFKILVRRDEKEISVRKKNEKYRHKIVIDNCRYGNKKTMMTNKDKVTRNASKFITKPFICASNSRHPVCDEPIKYASFVAWAPINTGIIERSIPGAFYSPKSESLCARIRLYVKHYILKSPSYDTYVLQRVLSFLSSPDSKDIELLLVHFVDVDEQGHLYGFGSEKYLKQLRILDGQVRTLFDELEKDKWLEKMTVVITTDHGGTGTSHGEHSKDEMGSFVVVCGRGIQNKDIRSHEDEKTSKEDVRNMDCAAIVLAALGVDVPDWFDARIPKGIFE
ncbi:5336_t:CDS:1 [Paraglomus occultum]|uniref:5336_t:CDS:1 n=1 Tax=Paraglomus occultum TaxID=144539 RepID=A0A9N9FVR5_9GLOM|nr:5336_t:CDS:1 [Paraglomus occultum]